MDVSIVSIQTDQSHLLEAVNLSAKQIEFQSYQSKQINPDLESHGCEVVQAQPFQSYQSRQINPDI